jgi:hypothetical protein
MIPHNMKPFSFLRLLSTLVCGYPATAQVAFTNLDFEAAEFSVPPAQHDMVPIPEALPGWTVSVGSGTQDWVYYDTISLGGSLASLIDDQNQAATGIKVIDGLYSLALYTGVGAPSPTWIAQSGTVPTDSLSLQFVSWPGETPSKLSVTFGGTSLPFHPIKDLASGYTLYGADIASFAGTFGELRFTLPTMPPPYGTAALLDDIQFVVPEPSVWGLAVFGCFGLWWARRLNRSRS